MTYNLTQKKPASTGILFFIIILTVTGFDIFMPNLSMMRHYFQTTEYTMQTAVMLGPLMGALSGLFYGYYSQVYGRKPVMTMSLVFFSVGSCVSGFATNVEIFMMGRMIQSLGAGGLVNISIAMLGDLFSGASYARALATVSILFPITFATAPLLGAFLGKQFGWSSNFFLLTFVGLIVLFIFQTRITETLAEKPQSYSLKDFRKAVTSLLTSGVFLTGGILHALPIAIPSMFVVSNALLFIEVFNVDPEHYALLQLIPITVSVLTTVLYRRLITHMSFNTAYTIGMTVMAIYAFLTILAVFFIPVHIGINIFLNSFFFLGLSFLATTAATQTFELRPTEKGLSIAIVAMMRNFIIAMGIYSVSLFYNKTPYPLYQVTGFFALIIVALAYRQKRTYVQ